MLQEIRAAYRARARVDHPDISDAEDAQEQLRPCSVGPSKQVSHGRLIRYILNASSQLYYPIPLSLNSQTLSPKPQTPNPDP